MPDFYATSQNNAVEIDKDIYPYKDTEPLKKLVSGANVNITAEDLDGITTIRTNAFFSFQFLIGISIPDSVTSIGASAFNSCSRLTSVTIGNSVTSIGNNAFNSCSNLTDITCKATNPPTIQSNTFIYVPATCIIKVPAQSVEAYKSATNWSTRANYIQAI